MFAYAKGKDSKNQRNLSQDTHFAFLKGKFLNCYIGITDFIRGAFLGSLLLSYKSERSARRKDNASRGRSPAKKYSPLCRFTPFVERAFLNTEHGNCYGHYYPKTHCLKRNSVLQTPSADLLQSHEALRYEQ